MCDKPWMRAYQRSNTVVLGSHVVLLLAWILRKEYTPLPGVQRI